eukprot:PhM_4_TR18000/c0_g1_i1/m.89119
MAIRGSRRLFAAFSTSSSSSKFAVSPSALRTLGLTAPPTSPQDLRAAYLKQVLETHPDVARDDATAPQRFRQLTEAYHTLLRTLRGISSGTSSSSTSSTSSSASNNSVNRFSTRYESWFSFAERASRRFDLWEGVQEARGNLGRVLTSTGLFYIALPTKTLQEELKTDDEIDVCLQNIQDQLLGLIRTSPRYVRLVAQARNRTKESLPSMPRPLLLCGALRLTSAAAAARSDATVTSDFVVTFTPSHEPRKDDDHDDDDVSDLAVQRTAFDILSVAEQRGIEYLELVQEASQILRLLCLNLVPDVDTTSSLIIPFKLDVLRLRGGDLAALSKQTVQVMREHITALRGIVSHLTTLSDEDIAEVMDGIVLEGVPLFMGGESEESATTTTTILRSFISKQHLEAVYLELNCDNANNSTNDFILRRDASSVSLPTAKTVVHIRVSVDMATAPTLSAKNFLSTLFQAAIAVHKRIEETRLCVARVQKLQDHLPQHVTRKFTRISRLEPKDCVKFWECIVSLYERSKYFATTKEGLAYAATYRPVAVALATQLSCGLHVSLDHHNTNSNSQDIFNNNGASAYWWRPGRDGASDMATLDPSEFLQPISSVNEYLKTPEQRFEEEDGEEQSPRYYQKDHDSIDSEKDANLTFWLQHAIASSLVRERIDELVLSEHLPAIDVEASVLQGNGHVSIDHVFALASTLSRSSCRWELSRNEIVIRVVGAHESFGIDPCGYARIPWNASVAELSADIEDGVPEYSGYLEE